jgi:excisionase family DNA binding protein
MHGQRMTTSQPADDPPGARIFQFPAQRTPERWLTKQQLAAHLGYSTRWVEYRIHEGMPHERLGRRMRFRASDVETWLTGEHA